MLDVISKIFVNDFLAEIFLSPTSGFLSRHWEDSDTPKESSHIPASAGEKITITPWGPVKAGRPVRRPVAFRVPTNEDGCICIISYSVDGLFHISILSSVIGCAAPIFLFSENFSVSGHSIGIDAIRYGLAGCPWSPMPIVHRWYARKLACYRKGADAWRYPPGNVFGVRAASRAVKREGRDFFGFFFGDFLDFFGELFGSGHGILRSLMGSFILLISICTLLVHMSSIKCTKKVLGSFFLRGCHAS